MTEQFALQQFGRNGTAVDGDERVVFSRSVKMNGLGHQLLAGSRFAKNQNGRVGVDDLFHSGEDLLHGGAVADDVVELVLAPQLLTQVEVLGHQPALFDGLGYLDFKFFEVEGLGDVVESSFLHRFDGGFGRGFAGHQDNVGKGRVVLDLF